MVTPAGVVVLTDRGLAAGPLPEVVAQAVRGGAAWVILRDKDLPYARRAALARTLRTVAPDRVIVAGPDPLGGNAVHLSARDRLDERVDLVGRSWHGTELLSDEDYVTLSPIYPTASKPGYGPALGPVHAAALAGDRPWLALGGVDSPARAAACVAAGAAGVAVMGAVMRAADPGRVVRELVAAVS
ncbi:thiamine phosphate synthase [Actinoplanes sp. N902-109]|uniref:thiamine phosphate synthase n=1 Tax=Actinoplanes sp. (strain N902-109) TaxID=649831 RepID=UPI0003293E07|nr:thiamine phosphate synthase [Actinoplanes sp. N902-109]AGL14476.1 thiamine monophosphate synthase [Actinoplanes sp. N902-109]